MSYAVICHENNVGTWIVSHQDTYEGAVRECDDHDDTTLDCCVDREIDDHVTPHYHNVYCTKGMPE